MVRSIVSTQPRWAIVHPFQLRLRRGIEAHVWDLAVSLEAQGIDVDILCWSGKLEIPARVRMAGVKVLYTPGTRFFERHTAIPWYAAWLATRRYDHVMVHFAGYGEGAALRLARHIRRIPFTLALRFPRSQVPHRYEEYSRWGFDTSAEHILGVAEHVSKEAAAWCGRDVPVIDNGVDSEAYAPNPASRAAIRNELGLRPGAPLIVTTAALEERKGVQWLIRAMPAILTRHPDAHYVVLGEGSYRDNLEEQIAALQLGESTSLLGMVANVPHYLAAADLAVLLSVGEASPIAMREYMSTALPVITSRHPPFDLLVDNAWGTMVDPEDTHGLAMEVTLLLKDAGRRGAMGAAGRSAVLEKYSLATVAGRYIDLIGRQSAGGAPGIL